MSKEFGNVTESVGFVSVDRIVVCAEGFFEEFGPETVELCETLTDQAVEFAVCALLGAALDDHGAELQLLSGW